MIRRTGELERYTVHGRDGDVGPVEDLLFDDGGWTVRYLVVNTGGLLSGKRALLSTASVQTVDWEKGRVEVALTGRRIDTAPGADDRRPVTRRHEEEIHAHYGWPLYWETPGFSAEARLRSVREVTGYNIHTRDGELGHVDDFLVEEVGWAFRYLLADTGIWLSGRKVLVAVGWILEVSWRQQEIFVSLTKDQVRSSPEYHSAEEMLSREYSKRLHAHYGFPFPSHMFTGDNRDEGEG